MWAMILMLGRTSQLARLTGISYGVIPELWMKE